MYRWNRMIHQWKCLDECYNRMRVKFWFSNLGGGSSPLPPKNFNSQKLVKMNTNSIKWYINGNVSMSTIIVCESNFDFRIRGGAPAPYPPKLSILKIYRKWTPTVSNDTSIEMSRQVLQSYASQIMIFEFGGAPAPTPQKFQFSKSTF